MGASAVQLYMLMYLEFLWLLVPEQGMNPGKISACDTRHSSSELVQGAWPRDKSVMLGEVLYRVAICCTTLYANVARKSAAAGAKPGYRPKQDGYLPH